MPKEFDKEKFSAYEQVRICGETNMFNVTEVIRLAKKYSSINLTRADILDIYKNYSVYKSNQS